MQTFEKSTRRSVSANDTPTRNMPNTQRRYKGTSDVENRKKRFSSDPESVNLASKKAIPEVSKKKGKLQQLYVINIFYYIMILLFNNQI
jgi:hypothetical protein